MRIFISIILMMIAIVLLIISVARTNKYTKLRKKKEKKHPDKDYMKLDSFTTSLYIIAALLFVVAVFLPGKFSAKDPTELGEDVQFLRKDKDVKAAAAYGVYRPASESYSNPTRLGVGWEAINNGIVVTNLKREERIYFGDADDYFALPGVSTFRGNNYRDSATYGTGKISSGSVEISWERDTGVLIDTSWAGCGWTGQPLVVEWDEETRQIMNLYNYKKDKNNLVEVIYPTLDGRIYFFDLEDGNPTRKTINIGMCFNGSGTLDPRGYPLLYVGAGDKNSDDDTPKMYIISLITGRVLFSYGGEDRLSLRTDNNSWSAYDTLPLVDAETDTLIWAGENGIIYTFKLNTVYDKEAGTISVSPDTPVRARYFTNRMEDDEYWYGYEASPCIVENYMYITDNGGMLYCVDLTTMEVVWAQDIQDDSNSTPVFERTGEGSGYVYAAPTLHWTEGKDHKGIINLYKIDAITGKIIWQVPYEICNPDSIAVSVTGGVQSTPLLGADETDIEGLIIYTIARTPEEETGLLVALDKETGEEVWRHDMEAFTSSSPTAVYSKDGTSYIVVCDSLGTMTIVRGSTGTAVTSVNLGSLIESSPVVFEDTIVVGTCGQKIFAIQMK